MSITEHYQELLMEELSRRCDRNPRYSARAFARALEIDAASLSRILTGKQIPSYRICQQLFAKLELSPSEQQKFLSSVTVAQKARGVKRVSPGFKTVRAHEARVDLSTDLWRSIADWYHGAIMELTFTENFNSDPAWIAKELFISEVEIRQAIKRLIRLGLLEEREGVLVKCHAQVSTADKNITTSAHRRLQKQVLEKAAESLENDPIDVRNMTAMVMAVDPKKIPVAKRLIQEFSRELCAYLETGKRTQVYQMGVSLYPLSRREEK